MPTWQIDAPQRLTLDGDVRQLDVWFAQGKLRVVGTEGPPRIDIRKVGSRGITISLEEGILSVRHPLRTGRWGGAFWWFASGLREGATVDVTSGSITLMGLGGQVRAKTISGSIEAMGVAGDLRMETVSGEISLAESPAEQVFARTISGAVTCDLDNPEAYDVRLSTTSGEITVRVPSDADLNVNLNATSGRVRSAFPEVRGSGMPGLNSASGRLGTGRGTLQAHAVSGSVSLLSRPSETFEPEDAR